MQFSQITALFVLCALLGLSFAAPIDCSAHGIERRQTEQQLQSDTAPVTNNDGTLSLYNPADKGTVTSRKSFCVELEYTDEIQHGCERQREKRAKRE
ncbi:11271_t:CDS:2 [Paraglomus occultum]|uniref:11271_t:CDS:1 n=1 Tax=Paraglomus occultum TaxID=144539 RepID=A0A9N8ZHZ3_9GLOM|nr:11271_t:CDS:2 [Paraglomus occultum]